MLSISSLLFLAWLDDSVDSAYTDRFQTGEETNGKG